MMNFFYRKCCSDEGMQTPKVNKKKFFFNIKPILHQINFHATFD